MKTTTVIEPNYGTYYNPIQLMLPMDISLKIDENDMVFTFISVMKGIDLRKYVKRTTHRGNQGYDPYMMLNVMLFAEMEGENSDLRVIEKKCKRDLSYLYLSNELMPSHMAFQRFEQKYLKKSIKDIFIEISDYLADKMDVNRDIVYIDGTKLEANAYKNSFVYKTRVVNAQSRLYANVTELIWRLNQEFGYNFRYGSVYSSQEIGYIAQYLMEVMVREKIEIVYGIGKRKSVFQKYYDTFLKYALKLMEYEENIEICGKRNSYSKTDHDATMMNTKYDYYNQTGVSKPCYNIQAGVSNGLVMLAKIFQTPGDTTTFIPFMEEYKNRYGYTPNWPITDAGYGSYENYFYCLENGMNLGMKYSLYSKRYDKEYQKRKYHAFNWPLNEEGYKVCPNKKTFNIFIRDKVERAGKYLKISQLWGCDGCEGCPLIGECTKKGNRRLITVNPILNEFYETVDNNLRTEEGIEMKIQRSAQAEGIFGVMKQDRKYARIKRRGLENVEMEVLKYFIGYNLMKYHRYLMAKKAQA